MIREGIQTIAATPLVAGDERAGVLNLVTRRTRAFPPEERALLAAIGRQLGIAVQNARLHQRLQRELTERKQVEEVLRRSEQELTIRNRIADIFLTVPDDRMYAEVLQVVLEAMESKYGVFGFIDQTGALVVPSMTRHIWDGCQVPDKAIVFPKEKWGESIWPRAMRQKKTLFSNEPSTLAPKGHVPILRNITVPIIDQQEAVGLFQVANKETDYDQNDIRLLEIIAAAVAPVLHARLQRDAHENERRCAEDETRQRTAQLEAANKELEAFAYSVSHDLRAPLRSIDGFSQALLEDCRDLLDERGKDYLQRVRAATQRMGELIDDLLGLSRVTRAEMRREPVSLSEMARSAAEEMKRAQPERSVAFVIQDGLVAEGDGRLLRVVLENLLGNAWKFSAPHPATRIEFGARGQPDGRVAYFVRDDGVGFDMAYADKLFGAFQRLHAGAEFAGSGIGLASVQRIVHRHGGRVWAEGAVEQGAAFYFTVQ